MIIKKDTANNLPVLMLDSSGVPVTGIAWDDATPPTVNYAKEGDSSLTSLTLSAGNWIEIGQGVYEIAFTAGILDTKGKFIYLATGDGALQYSGLVEIKDNDIDDIGSDTDAIKAKTDNLPSDPASETNATANKTAIISAVESQTIENFSIREK